MIVNEQVAVDHGLKKDEYAKICELLKRTPNITELGIFSAMWNEHCSYKSSRLHLKKLPTKGKKVIQGPGIMRRSISKLVRTEVKEPKHTRLLWSEIRSEIRSRTPVVRVSIS